MPRTALTFPKRKTVENLLTNGDFEYAPPFTAATNTAGNWIDGTAAGSSTNSIYKWSIPAAGLAGGGNISFDSTVSKSGTYSLKVSTGTVAGTAVASRTLSSVITKVEADTTLMPALPNTSYTLTAFVKTNNAATNAVYADIRQYDGTLAASTTTPTNKLSGTNDWTPITVTITTGSSTRYLGVLLRNAVTGNVSDAWFDDITLVKSPVQTRTANTFPRRRTPDNLLSNGNFEYVPPFTAATTGVTRWIDGTATGSGNTESPYGWWTPSSFVSSAAAQFDTSVYRSGTASLKLSTLNATGVANACFGNNSNRATIEKTTIPALPNTSYTVTGWVKTNNVNTSAVYIDVVEYNAANGSLVVNSTTKLSGTNDWTQLTKTFTTNANTRYLLVVLRNNVAGNVSDAWFDDITLTKVPAQTRTVVT